MQETSRPMNRHPLSLYHPSLKQRFGISQRYVVDKYILIRYYIRVHYKKYLLSIFVKREKNSREYLFFCQVKALSITFLLIARIRLSSNSFNSVQAKSYKAIVFLVCVGSACNFYSLTRSKLVPEDENYGESNQEWTIFRAVAKIQKWLDVNSNSHARMSNVCIKFEVDM